MIERLLFPGAFFCSCGRLEAVFGAAMGISLPTPQNAPEMPLKCLYKYFILISNQISFSTFLYSLGEYPVFSLKHFPKWLI